MKTKTQTQRVMVIAGIAGADVRTVRKFLEGKPVKGAVLRERLEAAVRSADKIAASVAEPNKAA
jgi:hypothetical protein